MRVVHAYVLLTGCAEWSASDLATDLGWSVQRVGLCVSRLVDEGLVERRSEPIMGGVKVHYTFTEGRA